MPGRMTRPISVKPREAKWTHGSAVSLSRTVLDQNLKAFARRAKNAERSGFFGILCFVWFRQSHPSLQIVNERQSDKFKDAAAHILLGMGGFCGVAPSGRGGFFSP